MPIFIRGVYSVLTLYMLLILIRWIGPWLGLDPKSGRLRWISRITDPLIDQMRRVLPSLGPFDFGPMAALVLVWLVRALSIRIFIGMEM